MSHSSAADPLGRAVSDFYERGAADRLLVLSPQFDDDELPVATFFRTEAAMAPLERTALRHCRGRVLDVGAGAGCHSLALQAAGLRVTAVDVSPLAVQTMRRRGVAAAHLADFYGDVPGAPYDTLLFLMNGLGLAGTLDGLPRWLERCRRLLAPGGQVLADSSDLRYLFEDEDGQLVDLPDDRYYGEVDYTFSYRGERGRPFRWLYVDFDTLAGAARACGFRAELLARGEHYDYLARLTVAR